MEIRKGCFADAAALAKLACRLWPGHSFAELEAEFAQLLSDGEAACFLACTDAEPVGFAQCQLRHDYVEGTDSSPVGYLEGIYVAEAYRRRGLAAKLLAACEAWAREQGCTEFASDCELTNSQSQDFHQKLGFTEVNRIICFTKRL